MLDEPSHPMYITSKKHFAARPKEIEVSGSPILEIIMRRTETAMCIKALLLPLKEFNSGTSGRTWDESERYFGFEDPLHSFGI